MTTKTHKIETISKVYDRENLKCGFTSPPPTSNFKKTKDRSFSASRTDSQAMSFRRDGGG
ncbi:hypothetical protein EPI10_021101 [Gossypium australe]|uniref:Uncharacterized protein n=1 Tax=Gossypium australe TaxID=47621 RepID=A0A5B6WH56_9ROSI|nr:hypothetical protein EPI10_021101 [Gossypium australe]